MIRVAIALVVGSIVAFYSNLVPDRYWISYLPVLLLLALLNSKYRFPILLVASYLWACLNIQNALDVRLSGDYDNHEMIVTGIVADIPERRSGSTRFLFKPETIADYPYALPDMVRLSWYRSNIEIRAGEQWQLRVKLKSTNGYQNPGGFDYERWLFVKRIGASGYVKSSPLNRLIKAPAW